MKKDYPKMLFKALASTSEAKEFIESDKRIGYIIVDSLEEKQEKNKEGWGDLKLQKEKLVRIDKSNSRKALLSKKWNGLIPTITIILVLIGTIIMYLTYLKS